MVATENNTRIQVQTILKYHEASKHRLGAYAPGPERVDWDTQPNPFRQYSGAPREALPLLATDPVTSYSDLFRSAGTPAVQITKDSVGTLLALSFGLSAWKTLGPDRWAVRCTPSSGNLHPTETYILAGGVKDLSDGVFHYDCETHALELRCGGTVTKPGLWVGLSTILWREAWKYGVRSLRYCSLDIGHAIGAVRLAAATLGWSVRLIDTCGHDALGRLLGTDRRTDFASAEAEEPQLLLQIQPSGDNTPPSIKGPTWHGVPSRCDPREPRSWSGLAAAQKACRATELNGPRPTYRSEDRSKSEIATPAAALIRNRRSARRFTSRSPVPYESFNAVLHAALPQAHAPWDVFDIAPACHLLASIHNVEGFVPGLYVLPRSASGLAKIRAASNAKFTWQPVSRSSQSPPLILLHADRYRPTIRRLSCHQAIAGEGAATFAVLAEFQPLIVQEPWRYRQLHWEAGLIGQALYLAAESEGLRGSGIGCFFDDEMHKLLGLATRTHQVLYHFAIGYGVEDSQIKTTRRFELSP